jgi:predicted dehydrogenase
MHTVAIIGAGQLGSRHLQGLAKVAEPLAIYLLDPSPASLEVAKGRFLEVAGVDSHHTLSLATDPAAMPGQIDLLISATTAGVRLASLRALLAHSKVKAVVLEKVLFQQLAEYDEAAALLRAHDIAAWVNCPRRSFAGYAELKAFFGEDTPVSMHVTGSNWGLGCNGVHFADLFAFLSGDDALVYDASQLDPEVHASKRDGFYEFSGTLVGRNGRHHVTLQASPDGSARHLILLRSAHKAALVDEVAGIARLLDADGSWREHSFSVPFQSQLTGQVASDVLAGRAPALPDFASSARLHTSMISPLLAHFNRVTGANATACPIT